MTSPLIRHRKRGHSMNPGIAVLISTATTTGHAYQNEALMC